MAITIVPYIDPHKSGASDHVYGICNAAAALDVTIQLCITVDAVMQSTWTVDARTGYNTDNNTTIVVVGDYCTAEMARKLRGQYRKEALIVASSYTILSNKLVEAWLSGAINWLAVPQSELTSAVINQSPFSEGIRQAIQANRVIPTTLVPHTVTPKTIEDKWQEWKNKANSNGAIPLPQITEDKALVFVVIPGDVEDQDGKAILFTPDHAKNLAKAIYENVQEKFGANVQFLVTSGARTGKYNPELIGNLDFDCHNPNFHNQERFGNVQSNPVTQAFLGQLRELAGTDNIFSACIGDRAVPAQGFLAFYHMLNQHAEKGGKSVLYLDGVSVTMTAQALSVMDSRVALIACDTPAKNPSHIASVQTLFERGYVSLLSLYEGNYVYKPNHPSDGLNNRPVLDDGSEIVQALLRLTASTRRDGH